MCDHGLDGLSGSTSITGPGIFFEYVDDQTRLGKGIPDASLTRRLGRLVSVLPAVEPIKEKLEYIDLGLDNSVPLKVNKDLPPEKLRELAAQKQKVAVGVNGVETKPEPN